MSRELVVPRGLSSHRFRAMGSTIHLLVPERFATAATGAVERLFSTWEAVLSRFLPGSELSRLNARAGTAVRVGPILLAAVEASLEGARATGGLFDPTLGHELVRLGYDRSFEELGDAPAAAGKPRGGGAWRSTAVDRSARLVTLPAKAGLDLGGIAKGMAVDASLELLAGFGIETALVSAGGDLAVLGLPPGERAWGVLAGSEPQGEVVPLVRGALATSGTSRRRWRQGDAARHHLVDPDTGEPVSSGLREVTVAGGTCRIAEVGATAAFVAGPRLGPVLLRRLGLAGLLVTEGGSRMPVGRWPGRHLPHAA
jgi:thiamine biosynthesis lipoprotein